MMRSIYYLLVAILCMLMVVGCAQRGDNHNPLGLTGGSDGGYGKRQSSYYYQSSLNKDGNNVENVWTEDDNTLTINADGTFELKSEDLIRTGTYSKENDKLTLNFEDEQSIIYAFSIEKGQLVLTEVE